MVLLDGMNWFKGDVMRVDIGTINEEMVYPPKKEETDLDRFLKFYSMVGIKLEPSPDKNELGNTVYLVGADSHYGDRFDGYTCFYSDIEFTKEGEFVRQGFWE